MKEKLSRKALAAAKRIAKANGIDVEKVVASYFDAVSSKAKVNVMSLFLPRKCYNAF